MSEIDRAIRNQQALLINLQAARIVELEARLAQALQRAQERQAPKVTPTKKASC